MRNFATLALCGVLALGLSGCAASGEGTASAYVKDAPSDQWRHVYVTFTEVSIHQSGGNDTSGWKVLFSDSAGVTVDLLNLTGAKAAFLGASGLPAGHYQQVRIMATKASGVDLNNNTVDIAIPEKGYLRAVKSFKVEEGKETQITIDIDLEKALVQKGSAWEFKGKIGKVYTDLKEKGSHPAKGTTQSMDLGDDASA